ncbi:hypothetical protein MMPV_009818 [Pyropia vietnamensis]
MDHAEEQEQEREALAAIFLDDYTPLSDDGRRLQLSLSHPAAGVSAKLIVTLPPTYPEVPPAVSLHPGSGLTAPRRAALLAALDAEAATQVGMPMIFGLHSFAMDWLQANVAGGEEEDDEDDGVGGLGASVGAKRGLGGGSTFETREETGGDGIGSGGGRGSGGGADSSDSRGDRVAAKAYGTPVTVESFTAWSIAFEAEMAAARAAAAATAATGAGEAKLTGRQLFEQNKAVGAEDDSESFWEAEAESELAAS